MKNTVLISPLVLATLGLIACSDASEQASDPSTEEIVTIEEEVFEAKPEEAGLAAPPNAINITIPNANPRRGRILFTVKGCVICHQVNGVGGRAAPDLSRRVAPDTINPLTFSARMWRGAAAMSKLQSIELGYTIELDAQDIADLAAFAENPEEQALFTENSVGTEMKTWFLDDKYWLTGNWDAYKARGERIPEMDDVEIE